MKKVLLITVLAGLSFASCKKDYTCTCTGDNGFTSISNYSKVKKADAKDACSKTEAASKLVVPSATCSI
jgi:hypothetical protein